MTTNLKRIEARLKESEEYQARQREEAQKPWYKKMFNN